jgi:hypothetical protein
MAKTQKYSEDQLLEAVIKFSEIEKKKIKATELAKWSRDNIEGLEEVRDYHFTRSVKERDKKTGKMTERPKLCAIKMNEINKARDVTLSINTNLLLKSSNINNFFEQSNIKQRKMVVETREIFDMLLNKNIRLTRENEALKAANRSLQNELMLLKGKIIGFEKKQNKLMKLVKYVTKATDESKRKEMLAEMGIKDGEINLNQYNDSLQQNLVEVMKINSLLQKYMTEKFQEDSEINKANLKDDIMSGIDF